MKHMKVTVIGAGGAFADSQTGNSAFLVEYNGSRILIDCGLTVPYALEERFGIPLTSITDVIITHVHCDHHGGLELLLHKCRWIGKALPTVWARWHVLNSLDDALAHLAYDKRGTQEAWTTDHAKAVRLTNTNEGPGGLPIRFYKVEHVGAMPCSAIKLGRLAVSGDTKTPVLNEDFWDASRVFHDVELDSTGSLVHCPLSTLADYVADADGTHAHVRGKCVHPYHCGPIGEVPKPLAAQLKAGDVFEVPV